jgi:hypothetical protein
MAQSTPAYVPGVSKRRRALRRVPGAFFRVPREPSGISRSSRRCLSPSPRAAQASRTKSPRSIRPSRCLCARTPTHTRAHTLTRTHARTHTTARTHTCARVHTHTKIHTGVFAMCTATGLAATPQLHRDWGSPLPHLRRDRAHPSHICAGTGLPSRSSRLRRR